MEHPTKGEVESKLREIDGYALRYNLVATFMRLDYKKLAASYLALMEEAGKREREWVAQNALWIEACKDRDQLKADNEALRAQLDKQH